MNKNINIVILAIILILNFNLYAQNTEMPLSKKEQQKVVTAISTQLENTYIFPDIAKKMTSKIQKQLKKGHYKKIDDPVLFANKLTEDLLSISHDKHIRVTFDPIGISRQNQASTDEELEELRQNQINSFKKKNFGFKELKILDGNIGYLDLRGFSDTSFAGETAVAAMNYLSNTDAIIFDLRHNGGGSPTMIQLITSYLYDSEPVHLNNFYWRPTDLHTQTWTLPHVPGKRSPDTPVYVLTSGSTFSAAEEFSYNLKNLKRATLVGETTGGGAHPGDTVNATDRFQVWIPSGRAINPITNTNWEGTGVTPHIQVKQEDALNVAYKNALETLLSKSTNDEYKHHYKWAIDGLNAKASNIKIDENILKTYVGHYGPRVISIENGSLYYQRGTGTKYPLKATSQNTFILNGLGSFRIEFELQDKKVIALIGKYDNGHSDKNAKD